MALWEPEDIDPTDHDGSEDGDEWDYDFKSNLEIRDNKLRGFNETLNESTDEDTIEMKETAKNAFKPGTIEFVANQIYDKLTILFNNTRKRLGIHKGEPIRNYHNIETFQKLP